MSVWEGGIEGFRGNGGGLLVGYKGFWVWFGGEIRVA